MLRDCFASSLAIFQAIDSNSGAKDSSKFRLFHGYLFKLMEWKIAEIIGFYCSNMQNIGFYTFGIFEQ